MKIIGITGGIGAGKSTVCAEFAKYGAEIVDADQISHQVTSKNGVAYGEIVDFFGSSILDEIGNINRKKLAEVVFSDKEKLKKLNEITHKHIFAIMRDKIEKSASDVVILDVPLLFSSDFDIHCDLKIAVITDKDRRIQRVIKRDNTTEEAVISRMNNQLCDKQLQELADECIINNNMDEMKIQVKKIIETVRG